MYLNNKFIIDEVFDVVDEKKGYNKEENKDDDVIVLEDKRKSKEEKSVEKKDVDKKDKEKKKDKKDKEKKKDKKDKEKKKDKKKDSSDVDEEALISMGKMLDIEDEYDQVQMTLDIDDEDSILKSFADRFSLEIEQ